MRLSRSTRTDNVNCNENTSKTITQDHASNPRRERNISFSVWCASSWYLFQPSQCSAARPHQKFRLNSHHSLQMLHDDDKLYWEISLNKSKFDHFSFIVQEPSDVLKHLPNKLLLFSRASPWSDSLQNLNKACLHKSFIELLVWVNVEECVDHLSTPLLQLKMRNINNQIFQDLPNATVLFKWNCIFLRVKVSWIQLKQENPTIFIIVFYLQNWKS